MPNCRRRSAEAVVAQVDPVEQDLAVGRVVEAHQQSHQRRLAGARRAADPDARARRGRERHAVQHRVVGVVGERDIEEQQAARGPAHAVRIFLFGDFRHLVEQRKGTLGARHRRLERDGLLAEHPEGLVDLLQVRHHEQQAAQAEGAGAHLLHADEERRGASGRHDERHEQVEAPLERRHFEFAADAPVGLVEEPLVLAVLAPEGLDHADGGEHFLHDAHRRAVELLDLLPVLAQPRPERPRQQEQDRADRQGHHRQPQVDARGDDNHRHQGHARAEERNEAVDDDALDGRGVVLDAVRRVRRAGHVVVGEREPLDVPEQARPEILGQLLAGIRLQEIRGHVEQGAEHRREDEQRRRQPQEHRGRPGEAGGEHRLQPAGKRPRPDHRVHGNLERQWPQQRERRGQELQEQHEQDLRPVRTRIGREPAVQREMSCLRHRSRPWLLLRARAAPSSRRRPDAPFRILPSSDGRPARVR